ncbi:hypothetical protein [Actinomadura sp. 6K520]|uniref:hypothetical protein n=1 Tax=Actinomadura sp. 6K520 TaxID=2530364 RepID=UPI00104EBDD9|nr:hypothetical protein [Actinomadura sp. 6K520]TDE35009.1 hypothetical protein E1289_08790 [Actinomadura sp. 6K520]
MTITAPRATLRAQLGRTLWRRSAYTLAALPAALASLAGAPVQASLAQRLLDVEPKRRGRFPTILHALLSIPLNVLSLLLVGYGWSIVVLNLLYPGRWLIGIGGTLDDAWGGPTLAGAWAVHALGGLVMLALMPVILKALTALHARLLLRVLGGTMGR